MKKNGKLKYSKNDAPMKSPAPTGTIAVFPY